MKTPTRKAQLAKCNTLEASLLDDSRVPNSAVTHNTIGRFVSVRSTDLAVRAAAAERAHEHGAHVRVYDRSIDMSFALPSNTFVELRQRSELETAAADAVSWLGLAAAIARQPGQSDTMNRVAGRLDAAIKVAIARGEHATPVNTIADTVDVVAALRKLNDGSLTMLSNVADALARGDVRGVDYWHLRGRSRELVAVLRSLEAWADAGAKDREAAAK